jgi:hypothetical protein
MRGSLTSVRTRVDRLASQLRRGSRPDCPECHGQEATPHVCCVYGDELSTIPAETRCATCGRVVAYRSVTIRYDANMKPSDMD